MGNIVWIVKEGQSEDNRDHSQILKEESHLNKLTIELNLTKSSYRQEIKWQKQTHKRKFY